jgi:hypothetical protein
MSISCEENPALDAAGDVLEIDPTTLDTNTLPQLLR